MKRRPLVPLTGWRCVNCGHMTDRGFPIMTCCTVPVHLRVLAEEPHITPEELAAIDEARRDDEEASCTPA